MSFSQLKNKNHNQPFFWWHGFYLFEWATLFKSFRRALTDRRIHEIWKRKMKQMKEISTFSFQPHPCSSHLTADTAATSVYPIPTSTMARIPTTYPHWNCFIASRQVFKANTGWKHCKWIKLCKCCFVPTVSNSTASDKKCESENTDW